MSDDFDEILASLNAGENPTSPTNGEMSMRSPISGKKETEFGHHTIMEYVEYPTMKEEIYEDSDDEEPEISDK